MPFQFSTHFFVWAKQNKSYLLFRCVKNGCVERVKVGALFQRQLQSNVSPESSQFEMEHKKCPHGDMANQLYTSFSWKMSQHVIVTIQQ